LLKKNLKKKINLFKENLKGLDPEELRRLIENLDFLKSLMLN